MTPPPHTVAPPLVAGVAMLIHALALWAVGFSNVCRSDGCIGIVFPAGAAAIALAVQLLILLPLHGSRLERHGRSATRAFLGWGGISLLAALFPLAFLQS